MMFIKTNRSKLGQVRLRSKPVYVERPGRSTVRLITIHGETHSLADWSRISGLNYHLLAKRLSQGVEPEFLLTPVRKKVIDELPEYKPSAKLAYLIEQVWYALSAQPSDCIEWPHGRSKLGYGRLRYNDRDEYAHRLAYLLAGNVIPDGHVIRHRCDNPPCFNVRHLETGTQGDNIQDSEERGKRYLNKIVKDLAFSQYL